METVAGYEIEGLVGRGGMAEVFRARATRGDLAGQTVAVKRLLPRLRRDPEALELFQREANLSIQLRHPAIVRVYESGVADEKPFIVMEYVDGQNLRQILARCASRGILLPIDFGAYLIHVVAQALGYAHHAQSSSGEALGVVHCDVSPSNVFVSRGGAIKLGDFGVARSVATGNPCGLAALGKVRYLAPEQLRGEPVTPRVDLFSLGAVFFEVLTNAPAFPGDDMDEIGQKVLRGELRAPSSLRPEIPPAIDALVLAALSPEPQRRPPSAAAFGKVLAARYDPSIGTPLAIAAVVRALTGGGAPEPR